MLVRARAIYLGAKTRHVIMKTSFGDSFNSSTLVDYGGGNIRCGSIPGLIYSPC